MSTVIVDLSVSLDGFIAGAGDGTASPLGRGGEALFAWMACRPTGERGRPLHPPARRQRAGGQEWYAEAGAGLSGRRTFDIAGGWAEGHPIDGPIFVVTHEPPTEGDVEPAGHVRHRRRRAGARAGAGGGRRQGRLGRRRRPGQAAAARWASSTRSR